MNHRKLIVAMWMIVMLFVIIFSQIGCGGSPYYSTPVWKTVDTNLSMNAVACGEGTYVAISPKDGFRVSEDANLWTYIPNPLAGDTGWNSIIWNGSMFIVVGNINKVLTSLDGRAWTAHDCGNYQGLSAIAWNGSMYVAVGANGLIITSLDLDTWTAQVSGTAKQLKGVVWTGTQFVTVGFNGTILTSPNGVNWTKRDPKVTNNLYAIRVLSSEIIAVGSGSIILTSYDGSTWTQSYTGYPDLLQDVAVNYSPMAIAVGSSGSEGCIVTKDITWTCQPNIFPSLTGICWSGLQWVLVGGHSVYTSSNGLDWTNTDIDISRVIWAGWQFVALCNRSHNSQNRLALTSSNGRSWIKHDLGTTSNMNGIAWNGLKLVAVGDKGTILVSPDYGSSWSPRSSGTTANLRQVVWNGTRFFALGNSGTLLTSMDGDTWVTGNSGTTYDLYDLTWNDSMYIMVGDNGSILNSTDGAVWTIKNKNEGNYYYPFFTAIWNGTMFVLGGEHSAVYSDDGIHWSRFRWVSNSVSGIVWNGSEFMTAGHFGISKSFDGINWIQCTNINLPSDIKPWLQGIAWNGSFYVAAGGGTILISE
jgi:hypothetical protein